jgi:hypothetical protein
MKNIKGIKSTKGIKSFLKKNFFYCLLIIVAVVPLLELFHPGLPITHDGQDHVARIANFYTNLAEGALIPRWAGNLNWGYGHPILMFLYPLPSYATSLIHFLGFSFVDSIKIFFALAFIASGLTMYLWLKEFLIKEGAFVGAMLYVFAPYRFVDLYVRGAIGEHAAFIFPPLILYFLFRLSKKWSYGYLLGGSVSLACLILAHNAISLMFLPLIILYAIFLIWQSKRKRLLVLSSLFLVILGFALSAFFWIPAFMEGKYTLRDIVTKGSVNDRFMPLQQLFYGDWGYGISGYFSVQVGLLHWFFVFLSVPFVFMLKKKMDKNWILSCAAILFFFFTIFLMTSYSQLIWEKITTLQKFQFPWRFLSLSVFLSSLLGAVVMSDLHLRFHILRSKYILIIFIGLALFFNKDYWHPKDYSYKPESFYTNVFNSTTDTGESSPIWSVRFMEKRPNAHMEVYDGKAVIKERERTSTLHGYTVDASRRTLMRENTLYFPGWKVLVDNEAVPVEFQSQKNRGIMTFFVEKGKHEVVIRFEETKLRMLANVISLVSLLVLLVLGIIKLARKGTNA